MSKLGVKLESNNNKINRGHWNNNSQCENIQKITTYDKGCRSMKFINALVCVNFLDYLISALISWNCSDLIIKYYFKLEPISEYTEIIQFYSFYSVLPIILICQFLISHDSQYFSLLVANGIFKLWAIINNRNLTNASLSISTGIKESIIIILNFIAFVSSDE